MEVLTVPRHVVILGIKSSSIFSIQFPNFSLLIRCFNVPERFIKNHLVDYIKDLLSFTIKIIFESSMDLSVYSILFHSLRVLLDKLPDIETPIV